MGQHTWFLKSKDLYFKSEALNEKLDELEEKDLSEFFRVEEEMSKIYAQNSAPYHDIFRTGKRNSDDTYTDDIIFSREECFEWINNPDNHVSFDEDNEWVTKQLNKFWDEYPDGVIYFG